MEFDGLVWNDENIRHIWTAHSLTVQEAEQAFLSRVAEAPTYGNRVVIFGTTEAGRALALVVARWSGYVVTVRPMRKDERKRYLKEEE